MRKSVFDTAPRPPTGPDDDPHSLVHLQRTFLGKGGKQGDPLFPINSVAFALATKKGYYMLRVTVANLVT